jgi:hypothetical protein
MCRVPENFSLHTKNFTKFKSIYSMGLPLSHFMNNSVELEQFETVKVIISQLYFDIHSLMNYSCFSLHVSAPNPLFQYTGTSSIEAPRELFGNLNLPLLLPRMTATKTASYCRLISGSFPCGNVCN